MRLVLLAAALLFLPACDDSPPADHGDVLTPEDCVGVAGSGAGVFTRETPMTFASLEEADRFCNVDLAVELGCLAGQPLEFFALLAVDGQPNDGGIFVPTACDPSKDIPPNVDASLLCDEFGVLNPSWKWQWQGLCGDDGQAPARNNDDSAARPCDAPSIVICYAPSTD